jgi:hypothetical protein
MSDKKNIKELLQEAEAAVLADAENQMTYEERTLHAVAKKLLLLERDLKAAGLSQTADMRVTRLLETIEKEQF